MRLHSYQRVCKTLPNHLILARNQRTEKMLCQAIALPHGLHWVLSDMTSFVFRRRDEVRPICALSAPIAALTRPSKARGETDWQAKQAIFDIVYEAFP